jgi:hypothetical protein
MNRRTVLRILFFLLALVGAWIAWQSTIWGMKAFPYIIFQIKSLNEVQMPIAYEAPVTALRMIGIVLFAIGLYRALELPVESDR